MESILMLLRYLSFSLESTLVILLSFHCLSCGGSSSPPTNQQGTLSTPLTIQSALDDGVGAGLNSVLLIVEQGENNSLIYSSGIQDNSTQAPIVPNSLFKIASNSKLFIAISAAKLANQNIISLDDTIAYWLPELTNRIENSETITLRLLLQHRSGVPDFDSQAGFSWYRSHTDIDQTLEYALDKAADFSPDVMYEYSNTNYLLIGKILDTALTYSHQTYIQDSILTPTNMNNTFSQLVDIDLNRLIRGYWDNVDKSEQDYAIPGGSMISTISDMALFIRALNTGDLLSDEERTLYSGVYGFGHSGWLPGYQSISRYHNDIDAVVIQFVNTTGSGSEAIANRTYENVLSLLRN